MTGGGQIDVEFETEAALRAWQIHPEHAHAKKQGINSFFSDYKVQICRVIRERTGSPKAPS